MQKNSSKTAISEAQAQRALDFLTRINHLGSEGKPGFDWPESSSDSRRIKQVSREMRGKSLVDSFASFYGETMVFGNKRNEARLQNITCKELKPGDVVELRILAIDKKGVTFEQEAYKETIISTVNLYQYPNFKKFIPKDPIKVKVMSRDINKVYVDPLQPILDDFISGINGRIKSQANVKNPITTKVFNLRHMSKGYIGNIRIDSVSDFCGKDMYMQAFIPGSQITLNIESDFEQWEGKNIDTFITNLAVKPGTTDITIACSAKEYLRFLGNINAINMFKGYCENTKEWKKQQKVVLDGNITGICNSRNKKGVFVEIPSLGITGMVPVAEDKLTSYHPGPAKVKITGFDELVRFNKEVGQMQHVDPYKIDNDVLIKCNLKCTLEFAE